MAKKSSAHTLEYILLGLIREQPDHGYALFERLRNTKELSLIWQVKRSKLYYLLDKLESEDLIIKDNIVLEDSEWEHLKTKLKNFRWGIAHKAILNICDAVENAETVDIS